MKRFPREPLVSDEAHIIATQLVEKKRNLSSIDSSIHPKLLAPLAAYRNQAIFSKQEQKKCFIEKIISELILIPPFQKNITSTASESSRQHEKKAHMTIKVTPEERQYINKIIDLLLTDSEIDTIDPDFIPKMLVVLKERKQKAQLNADVTTSRQIQQQMKKLEKMANSPDFNSQTKQKLIDNYNQILSRIQQLRYEYQDKIRSTLEQKEEAKNKIIEANNNDVIAFEEERESLENGDGFLPSITLRELYRKVKIVESSEEKMYLQKQIETQENAEMYEYLQRTDHLMKSKKERLKKAFYARKQLFEEQWESKQNKIKTQYDQLIAQERLQLETMKKRLINAGIEPPQDKQEYKFENDFETPSQRSAPPDPSLCKKLLEDDSADSSNLSAEDPKDDDISLLDSNTSSENKCDISDSNKKNENKQADLNCNKQNEPKTMISKKNENRARVNNNMPLNIDLTNSMNKMNRNPKEEKNSNDRNKSKFKEMVMKIFGNETQIKDSIELDLDLNQDSDLIDLSEFHDDENNLKKEEPLSNEIIKNITKNANDKMTSDLIFFSTEKDETEVPFFTDDGIECSMIRIEGNQSTSSIFNDDIFVK